MKRRYFDRYEIGFDITSTEPAEVVTESITFDDALDHARSLANSTKTRAVYIFDRLASWRQVQCWHVIDGKAHPISVRD